jgi:hypothetical protein
MVGVREKAQTVLTTATQQKPAPSPASTQQQDARHRFAVRCQNGHITTFDRREVCSASKTIMRGLDELVLTCPTCGIKMAVEVDCEGY